MARLTRLARGQEAGLTAIELAVVVAIMAILAGLVAIGLTGMNAATLSVAQNADAAEIQKAVDGWVGAQPASRYPVSTPVIVNSANEVVGSATAASNGLPGTGSALYTRIVFTDSFTNPEGLRKDFVPGFLQRLPKGVADDPNKWGLDEKGTVKALGPAPTSAPTSTPTAAPTGTQKATPTVTLTPTPTPTSTPTATATPTTTPTATPTAQAATIPTVVASVPVPAAPRGVVVDTSTHRAYVAVGNSWNAATYYVSVIAGTTDNAGIPVGAGDYSTGPTWIAVNANTSRVYVNHTGSNFATAINAATNSVIGNITTGAYPEGIVTNPLTNRLYVANTNSGNVSVFDTANDVNTLITTIAVPGSGAGITNLYLAIIPATNRVFVTAPGLNKIFVIDTGSNTIVQTFSLTWSPSAAIVANAATNRLYVAREGTATISVLDAVTGADIATVSVGGNPVYRLAINPTLNRVYVTTSNSSVLTVIDGATNGVIGTLDLGAVGWSVATDSSNGRIYVATAANTVLVLSE